MNARETKSQILDKLKSGHVRLTIHAHEEMVAEDFSLDDVFAGLTSGELLEDYPEHKRGACALFGGVAFNGKPIHIVCTTTNPILIVITVYEPKPPKWLTPTQRTH